MATSITILPESLANKIAAGEVVERPASVVKELVENALDAEATSIKVEISTGGRRLIRVSDNGHGMSPDDLLLSLERHATSKIKHDDDLMTIATLGFRGEALPSIASVCRLRLSSRERGSIEGSELYAEGGVIKSVQAHGMPVGTSISVEQLFFNTPARLKFMRSAETEAAHIHDLMIRFALARPDVSFSTISDGRESFKSMAGDLRERIASLVGRGTELFEVAGESSTVSVSGFCTAPAAARSSANAIYTYVNGRFVRDKVVQHAIMQAYRPLLEKGRYPLVVLFIDLAPGDVDINVHPTKHEVRFRQQQQVHGAISSVLSELLRRSPWLGTTSHEPLPAAGHESRETVPSQAYRERVAAALQQSLTIPARQQPSFCYQTSVSSPRPAEENTEYAVEPVAAGTGYFSHMQVIGQFKAAYILCQTDDTLVIIDQHAAYERVRFEELRQGFTSGTIEAQQLLMPETLECSYQESELLSRFTDQLQRLGFGIEPFGGQTWMISAIPRILGDRPAGPLIRSILVELEQHGRSESFDELILELCATVACHSVVRGTRALDREQITHLLASMDRTDFSAHCPHGRPVSHTITLAELEKLFHRT
ncbi:MAG: DNA mismatch repair endonuclease MutL [Trichlorobacter sp.]|jgi:DNA mismatch repair protein MutL